MKSMKTRALAMVLTLLMALSLLPVSALATDGPEAPAIVGNDSSVMITVKPNKTSCGCGESISADVALRNVDGTTTGLTGGFASELFVMTLTDSGYNPISVFEAQTGSGLDTACKFTFPGTCALPAGTYKITARKKVGTNMYFGEASFYFTGKQAEQTEPFIVTQPKNRTVVAGTTVKFSVKAEGDDLKYRWFVQKKGEDAWTAISGATKASLSFTAGKSMNGNLYRCEITGGESITSDAAKLTVVSTPRITTQPSSICVREGTKVTFKVKASGGSLKYQWYYQKPSSGKWTLIANATKASYSMTAKLNRNGFKYKCIVENKAGSATTRAAKLVVK